MIQCNKCKIYTTELKARYPENSYSLCRCGREYKIKPTWMQDYISSPKIIPLWFCEECGEKLQDLEEKSKKKTLLDFLGE